jgi:DNA-binding transcriptional regulator GbsR (MarR family)
MKDTDQTGVIAGADLPGSPDHNGVPSRRKKSRIPIALSETQWELIEVCVRASQMVGMPRSVGEILGFLFCATGPVTFDDIVHGLGISNGSASHGLRFLRRLGAINVSFYARDRRDFFRVEKSLRRIVQGYLAENVLHHLGGIADRLRGLEGRIMQSTDPETRALSERVTMLLNWNQKAGSAIAAALQALH